MKKMTAQEVIKRYHKGERNFSGLNLSGQSFKEQNLSGSDFSGSHIRSTNFAKANLSQTNFSNTVGGIQKRWLLVQRLLVWLMNLPYVIFTTAFGLLVVLCFISNGIKEGFWLNVICNFCFAGIIVHILNRQGFAAKASNTILLAVVVVVFGAFVFAGTAVAARIGAVTFPTFVKSAVAGILIIAVALVNIFVARQTRKGNQKFHMLRIVGNKFGAIGGTKFSGANLTDANFDLASLSKTKFLETNLTHVSWRGAKNLDFAEWGSSILANNNIRQLLVSHDGAGKNYQALDLSGVNLDSANLSGANFKQANLNNAILHHANLKNANLKETLCIGTDLSNVELTGACIQGWNIDHTTTLDDVDCQYVFLLEQPNDYGSRERRPHAPDKIFATGDFEKLYRKIITTVELLMRGGADPQAFQAAITQLSTENPDITPVAIQLVGNDVKVTIAVPEGSDKGKIERDFDEFYTAKLEAAKATALLEAEKSRADDLKEIHLATIDSFSKIFSNFTINNTAMSDSNKPNISAGANSFINTGKMETSGTINLGTISGTVTNAIDRIPDSDGSQASKLKELLTQLQQAIVNDSDLQEPDKVDLLEEVKNLADAGTAEEVAQKETLTRKAKKMFEATLKSLPDTAKIVEASSKLLPIILKVLGVSV
jgi:uncharacterized protein YjbI with pentapeptide repeats